VLRRQAVWLGASFRLPLTRQLLRFGYLLARHFSSDFFTVFGTPAKIEPHMCQNVVLRHARGYFAPAGTLALQVGCVYHWLRNMIAVSHRGNDQMRYIIGLVVTIVVIVIVLRVLGVI